MTQKKIFSNATGIEIGGTKYPLEPGAITLQLTAVADHYYGSVVGPNGRAIAHVTPVHIDIGAKVKRGAPSKEAMHVALYACWLMLTRSGAKKGVADEQIAGIFAYADGRAVRKVRVEMAQKFSDWHVLHRGSSGPTEPDTLVIAQTIIQHPGGHRAPAGGWVCNLPADGARPHKAVWNDDFIIDLGHPVNKSDSIIDRV